MRFGMCAPPARAAELAAIGYDYVEWPLSRTVGEMDRVDYESLRRQAALVPVRPEAWNVMLPGRIKVVGPDRDLGALRTYLESALARVAELGGEVVVFGSGESRRAPEGYAPEDALNQFGEACAVAGDVAQRRGVVIAIEPLNRGETNVINGVAEAVALVKALAHPRVRALSDLYHVSVEAEPMDATSAAGPLLAHVHVAAPDRTIPLPGRGERELRSYFGALRAAGYDGRVSIEARNWGNAEAETALQLLRDAWAASADHD